MTVLTKNVIGVIRVIVISFQLWALIFLRDHMWLMWFSCPKIWSDEPNFMFFFIFSVVTVFFCFATSENFHLLKLWKSFHNAFLYRKLCISCLISEMKNEKYDLHNFWSKTTLFIKNLWSDVPNSMFFSIFCCHCFCLFCHLRKFSSFKTLKKFW